MNSLFQYFFNRKCNNYLLLIFLLSQLFVSVNCQSENKPGKTQDIQPAGTNSVVNGDSLKLNAGIVESTTHPFVIGYPEFIDSVSDNYIYWKDGTKMALKTSAVSEQDLAEKNADEYESLLSMADPHSMLSEDYPLLEEIGIPGKHEDPGRFRNSEFLKKIYGNNSGEVAKNLVKVRWLKKRLNTTMMVNKMNGAAESLQKISDELDKLPEKFLKYLNYPAGTFVWRNIAGTKSLSAHSFAIAIDINVSQSDYWRSYNKGKDGSIKFRNSIPVEIVHIFEKHGWIWGGRWYHYDTMHFEYRPEIVAAVKLKSKKG